MILFIKGIFHDQTSRITKMLADLATTDINSEIDTSFLAHTIEMLKELRQEIQDLLDSGDLDIDRLGNYNIIRYNTFHEQLQVIELFRYLVIVNYARPEEYFKKKISRIYTEVNCLQKVPIVTTISNSENYYWALPTYDIIAVPKGEEKNLLNLPDLYHEMGHLIYNQYGRYLKGGIEVLINKYYQAEIQRVVDLDRDPKLITILREKNVRWLSTWVMEFTCDFIATYLVGPAYAWTNLKLTTLSSSKDKVYTDSASHPSDEARMRGISCMLKLMGHGTELTEIENYWQEFLSVTRNPVPGNHSLICPQTLVEQLAKFVFDGCQVIDLKMYNDQIKQFGTPISKILNDAWKELFQNPTGFATWEEQRIQEIASTL